MIKGEREPGLKPHFSWGRFFPRTKVPGFYRSSGLRTRKGLGSSVVNIATMLGSDKRREGARAKAQFFVGRFFRGLKAAIPGLKSGASTRRAKAQFFVGRFLRGLKAALERSANLPT